MEQRSFPSDIASNSLFLLVKSEVYVSVFEEMVRSGAQLKYLHKLTVILARIMGRKKTVALRAMPNRHKHSSYVNSLDQNLRLVVALLKLK